MLVVQAVASDVDDCGEGNFYFQTRCRNARQPMRSRARQQRETRAGWEAAGGTLQPVDLHIMCELVEEFIDDSVNPDRATNQFQLSVLGILEDEVVLVEVRQSVPPNAPRQLERVHVSQERQPPSADVRSRTSMLTYRGNVVHIWLVDHSGHGVSDGASLELIRGVLFPNGLEIKVGTVHVALQKGEVAGVRDSFARVVKDVLERSGK